jgi:O-glycosyl hydrolase
MGLCIFLHTIFLFFLVFSPNFLFSADINIDCSREHQTIKGLGGQIDNHNPGYSSRFWDLVFNDLGISALMLFPFPNHADLDQEEVFPVLTQANRHGVKHFFVCFSSPKAKWKYPDQVLRPEYYDDWAHLFLEYFNYIKKNTGVEITDMAPFNEPSFFSPDSYRNLISENNFVSFLKVAGPIIRSGNSAVKIHAPNDWNVSQSISYSKAILSDPLARRYVDVLSTHGYGGSRSSPLNWQTFASIAKTYNKATASTENLHCCGNSKKHPAGINTAKWIHNAFAHGNAIYFFWWEVLDLGQYRTHRGFVYSKDFPPNIFSNDGITKYGYAFKQFAHWIRPGAIRLEATSSDPNILITAYKHPIDKTFTLVSINDFTQAKTIKFQINNSNTISRLNIYRTSSTQNTSNLGTVSIKNNTFIFILPKESITTFTGDFSP